jgi:CubicO group peptidase (beta-lactamase class C family)
LIIEAVTKEDYFDYVRQELFLPLGMENTGWYHGDSLYQTVATAYGERDSLGVWNENPYLVMKGSSAGGGYSTVVDLLNYGRALAAGKVVPLSILAEMREDRFGHGYGYGLSLRTLNEKIVYGHNGGFPGVSGELDIFPESGLFVVSLSNRGPRDGWASCRSIVRNAIVGETEESVGILNADRLIEVFEQEGLAAAIAAIEEIGYPITTNQLISASERYDKSGQRAQAIDMLSICIKVDPENWFPVSIKADLQLQTGDTSQAILNWEKSLELNPDNEWARDRLAEMGE